MSLEDYEAIETTMHLLGNPANAARLRKSIADLDAGKGIERDIIPVKASGKSKKPRK
jgi:antitoxin YefM